MSLDNYPMTTSEKMASSLTGPIRQQTIRERLEEQKKALMAHLDGLNTALEFLDKNPSFENFHDILRKVGF